MKVTYTGQSDLVVFDNVKFPKDVEVDYDGERFSTLLANRFFKVSDDGEEVSEYPFPTNSKDNLEEWALANLGINLDKRKGLPKLIAEVEAHIGSEQS